MRSRSDEVFSDSYAQARERFLTAASATGATLARYRNPAVSGPLGEALHLDVAVLGPPDASRVLAVTSGTHGIEGFCGSAVQTAMLLGQAGRPLPPDTAVVLFHAVNPWGFAHRQRVTEENVDLNRNFVDHSQPYPVNPGYDRIHPLITPSEWTQASVAAVFGALDAFREQVGEQAFSDAYNGGQYAHPDGVFFGGTRPQWSNLTFRQALREHVGHASDAALIDLHTGIGPRLDHVFLCFHPPGSAAHGRARRWWGERAVNRQGSTHSALATYRGLLVDAFTDELAGARTTAVVIEFGTRSRVEMQRASLSLCWLRRHGAADPVRAREVFADYVEAFCPGDADWREAVLAQSARFLGQAIAGIASGAGGAGSASGA